MILHIKLPDEHLDSNSKDVVKAVMGIIATMSALVLGLLIASAKTSYDTQANEMQQLAAKLVLLDRLLISYGPETKQVRTLLKQAATVAHERIWLADDGQPASLDPSADRGQADVFYEDLRKLSPASETQHHAIDAAMQLAREIVQTRMLMFEQLGGSISWPLVVVLVSWVSVLFLGFSLLARVHATIVATVIVGAFSVASAVFLIIELSQPYQGIIRIPDTSFRTALAHMSQ